MFDELNVSLLNKIINFFKKKKSTRNLLIYLL